MRRVLLTALLVAGGLIVQATAADAVPGGWVDVDDDDSEIELGASDERSTGGSGGSGHSSSACTWSSVPPDEVDVMWWTMGSDVDSETAVEDGIVDARDYDWYWRACPDGTGGTARDLIPVAPGEPPVDPAVLRDMAIDRLVLPNPTAAMNPPSEQVVHIESWLWLDDEIWAPQSQSASAGAVTTTVTARPKRAIWDMGNGDSVVCDGPGTAYDPARPSVEQATDCSYTYRHSSAEQPGEAYEVTATIEWEISWTVTGAAGGGALPPMFTTAPMAVRVAEMQALNQ